MATDSASGTLGGLLEVSESLELGAARAYAAFAFLFGEGNARQKKFWSEMSREEWEHAALVGMARFLLARGQTLEEPAGFDYETAAAPTRQALAAVEASIREGQLTLRDAFQAAIRIERSETNEIFSRVCGRLIEAARSEGLTTLAAEAEKAANEGTEHVEHLIETMKRTVGDPELVRAARKTLS